MQRDWNEISTAGTMRIAEFFESVQGEGELIGTPSVFVRTTGCNLRCTFCDTPYTSWNPEGEQIGWKALHQQVLNSDCRHIVVTGGEPMLQPDVVPFTAALRDAGRHVTIETAGTVYRSVHADLMSISPKTSNSNPGYGIWAARHEQLRHQPEVIERLLSEYPHQVKFVVDRPNDLAEIDTYLKQTAALSPERIWLMPQGITVDELKAKEPWIAQAADERGFNVTRRLHVELFGNTRGT
jgi:7-carboxy-7-deazaguanine synthase